MQKIKIGKITSPHGIRGEFNVYPYTDIPQRFGQIKLVEMDGAEYKIERVKYNKNLVILKLKGIEDRNTTETLRNKLIFVDKDNMWKLDEDTYLVDELVGLSVRDEDGNILGELSRVIANPGNDLYEIACGEKKFMIPAVKEFVKNVDLENRTITIHVIEGLVD